MAYQNEPFSSPSRERIPRCVVSKIVFRVGGNSPLITDQNFRTISNFISPSNMHVPFPTLFRISKMPSISMSLVLQHALGNPTFPCLGCLMCLSSEESPYALSVLSFKSYLLDWWLYGNGRRRTSTHLLINPTSSAGIGSFTVDGVLHCYHI